MRAALTRLVRSARRELLSFDDPAGALGQGIPERFLEFADACVRSTTGQIAAVRRIAPRQGLTHIREPLRCPGAVRVTDSIPFKMVVADRTVAAVPLDLELHYNGVLLIRDPVVVQALVRTHRTWWDTGDDPTRHMVGPVLLPSALRAPRHADRAHGRGGRGPARHVGAHIQPPRR